MPSEGEPTQTIDEAYRDILAEKLCTMTLSGSFPSWALYEDFKGLLNDAEWLSMRRVEEAFEVRMSPARRPLHRAKARFIADHTICDLKFRKPSSKTAEYVYMQTAPYIPALPEHLPNHEAEKDSEAAWYDLIVQHYGGETHSEIVNLVMVKDGDHWIAQTKINENYVQPIEEHDAFIQFQTALEQGNFEEAQWLSLSLCKPKYGDCSMFEEMIESSKETFREIAAIAQKDLVIESQKMTYISQENMNPYTSAKLLLSNHGTHTIKNITMRTHTQPPQTCLLQNIRQQGTDAPLIIKPGETVTGYCALSENTLPMEKLTWFYFDISSDQ